MLCVLVCTRGAAFELDWRKFGGVSVNTHITQISLRACMHCMY